MEYHISESSEMSDQMELAPGLCGCEECVEREESSNAEEMGTGEEGSSQAEGSVGEESSQAGMTSLAPGHEQTEGVEYTNSSVTGRENRNKAMLLKER